MKVAKICSIIVLSFLYLSVDAQVLDPGQDSPLDGVYSKSVDTPHKKPVPYVQLREADIMWLQRVWREVDMRQKSNHSFYFPTAPTQGRKNFMTVIMEAIALERITAYNSTDTNTMYPDDTFKLPLTAQEASDELTYETLINQPDEFGDDNYIKVKEVINLTDITKFRIKEEVFFDKQRSVMETRILGIAPMKPIRNEEGDITGSEESFWIYFPEARFVFAEAEVYNVHNDADRMTYEELFWKRKFTSRLVKVSNVYDRAIGDYKGPLDALLEAEQLEEEIFNREHDIWSF